MRLSPLPVLLVLASCQFDATEQEVELLPEVHAQDLEFADANSKSNGVARPAGVDPKADIGEWAGTEESLTEDSLAARLQEEAHKRRVLEAEKEAALRAQELAERELLAAQAGWIHQRKQNEELQQEREFLLQRINEFDGLMDHILDFEEQNNLLRDRISNLEMELYEARVYEPALGDLSLEDALRATQLALDKVAAQDDGIELLTESDQTGLRIGNQLLFASGQIEIGIHGQELLGNLAEQLAPMVAAGGSLQIIGHTDSQQLAAQQHRFPLGNFQLSCRRALEVANCLIQAGIEPAQVSVGGVGEWQPLASNDTEEGRARNRRVEILVKMPDNEALPEESASKASTDHQ